MLVSSVALARIVPSGLTVNNRPPPAATGGPSWIPEFRYTAVPPKWGMNYGLQALYATRLRRRSAVRSPGALGHINPTRRLNARPVWFRRRTDMDMTKFFTEQVTSGSRGEASDEAASAEQGHDHDAHDLPLRILRLVPVP